MMRLLVALLILLAAAMVVLPTGNADITSADVEPASLTVGETGTASATFSTDAEIPPDAWVNITFPAEFSLDAGAAASCSFSDGTNDTTVASQTVQIRRVGAATATPAGSHTCSIPGVTNPTSIGPPGDYIITTANSTGQIETGPATSDTFVAAAPDAGTSTIAVNKTLINPGDSVNVTVQLLDAFGNANTTGDQTVTWTTTDVGTMDMTHIGGGEFHDPGTFGPTANRTYELVASFDGNAIVATTNVTVNAPPTADAGPDNSTTDSDDDGAEDVTLNGTASTDTAPGTIAGYSWAWASNSTALATGATPTASFSVGTHVVNLTVTDDDGATSAVDQVTITVNAPSSGDDGSGGGSSGGSGSSTGSHGYQTGYRYSASSGSSTQHTLTFQGGAVGTIDVTLDDEQSVSFTIRTRDQAASGLPDGFTSTTIWMDITVTSDAGVTTATVTLRPLDPSVLDGDWQDLVAFHQTDNGWVELPTTVEEQADGTIVVSFTTDSFSPFVLAFDERPEPSPSPSPSPSASPSPTPSESPTPSPSASPSPSNQTPVFGVLGMLAVLGTLVAVRRR